MPEHDDSLIEYPCDFPVKAMGLAEHPIEDIFIDILREHLPHQTEYDISRRSSSAGKYISITIVLKAENREQLDAVYLALSAHDKILMSL